MRCAYPPYKTLATRDKSKSGTRRRTQGWESPMVRFAALNGTLRGRVTLQGAVERSEAHRQACSTRDAETKRKTRVELDQLSLSTFLRVLRARLRALRALLFALLLQLFFLRVPAPLREIQLLLFGKPLRASPEINQAFFDFSNRSMACMISARASSGPCQPSTSTHLPISRSL